MTTAVRNLHFRGISEIQNKNSASLEMSFAQSVDGELEGNQSIEWFELIYIIWEYEFNLCLKLERELNSQF